MVSMSTELRRALESDCATGVEEVLDSRRSEDLVALRAVLRGDEDVPASFRQNAIQILGRWGDRESVDSIRALLPMLDERERINAVDALSRIGGPEAESAVLEATADESPDVRRFAAYGLSRLDSQSARDRLEELARADPERSVRAAAIRGSRRAQ
jgi:HEAT repeat protein